MSHRTSEKFANSFANHEGCRIVSLIINDEYKVLQETKKLLEKRIALDEQYARTLQELATSADRLAASTNPHPLVSVNNRICHKKEVVEISFSDITRCLSSMVTSGGIDNFASRANSEDNFGSFY